MRIWCPRRSLQGSPYGKSRLRPREQTSPRRWAIGIAGETVEHALATCGDDLEGRAATVLRTAAAAAAVGRTVKLCSKQAVFGGGKETRTPDPYAASVMLYQLSYAPIVGLTTAASRPSSWPKVRLLRTLASRSISRCPPELGTLRSNVVLSLSKGEARRMARAIT
jgi:hypothetical protein